jgi:hypothetical protein
VPGPRASRPTAPDWLGGDELLPWSWAVEQLTKERNYWLASVRRDGFPQARPLWGVWLDNRLYLSVGHAGMQRAMKQDEVSVHVDSAVDVVIIEGTIEKVGGKTKDVKEAGELYEKKYEYSADFVNFVVRPKVVYGWKAENVGTATKWTFD